MKTVVTILGLLMATVNVSQAQNLEGKVTTEEVKITNFGVSVTVDSAEDIESTFSIKDIKTVLKEIEGEEELSFEMTCNGEKISDNVKRKVSYRVTGNSNDKAEFLKRVKKVRKAAIQFYTNRD
ncbi:hypothetical protein [Psychroserpens sp. Hel_I_66]|uniref:hypothetical protein n=1 Tax=Psychroserpens sp. Hel_I_66 TaxID=1250004 RepID=UPI000648DACB|nr:hypothetical protein [Psychroserpens sp. Hel_I_66]